MGAVLGPSLTYLGTPKIEHHHVDRREADKNYVVSPLDVGQRRRRSLDIHQCAQEGPGE